jgi:hypothetical protein
MKIAVVNDIHVGKSQVSLVIVSLPMLWSGFVQAALA